MPLDDTNTSPHTNSMKTIRVLTATDLHQLKWVYQALERAVAEQKPDILVLVGDFLDGGIPRSSHYSPRECASLLSALPCEVVFVRGNHEGDNWEPFVDRWLELGRALYIPHGEAVAFGALVLVGFPCAFAQEEYFLMGRPNNTFARPAQFCGGAGVWTELVVGFGAGFGFGGTGLAAGLAAGSVPYPVRVRLSSVSLPRSR
jgi:hypothetical protein